MLAMRHGGGDAVRRRRQADLGEKLARRLAQPRDPRGRPPEPEAVRLGRLHRQRDIFLGGEGRKDAGDLERAREPEPRALGRGQRRDVAAGEADGPGVGRDLAGQLPDQRRLAGAVRADQRMRLAGADVERDVVGRDQRAERLPAEPSISQQGTRSRSCPRLGLGCGFAGSGKSTFGSGGASPAPVARISMPQMPSFMSSTRATSSGPKNSIQCSV